MMVLNHSESMLHSIFETYKTKPNPNIYVHLLHFIGLELYKLIIVLIEHDFGSFLSMPASSTAVRWKSVYKGEEKQQEYRSIGLRYKTERVALLVSSNWSSMLSEKILYNSLANLR